MRSFTIIVLLSGLFMAMHSDKPAYRLFTEKGKTTGYADLLKDASHADIVLFGELHDNPVCHWLEYELTKDLYLEKGKDLVLGAEMFETDNQLIINEYLAGLVKEKNFETEARLWPNYKTDYKPLLNFARDSSLRFIATNVPRRYAAMVNKSGFEVLETLGPDALRLLPPQPVPYDPELSCYKEITKSMGDAPSHVTANIAKAQALKDATMSNSILRNRRPGQTFLHFNGSYHSEQFQGIVWYLKQADPTLKIVTIASVTQDDIDELADDSKGKADYILVVPESMTRTGAGN